MIWHLSLSLERVILFLKVQLMDIFVWYKSCDAMRDINFAFVKGWTCLLGIDCDEARNEEERMMLEDAKEWLNSEDVADIPHPKTGATALHVAAAKGYIKVMR